MSAPLDEAELAAIEARAEAASNGPWLRRQRREPDSTFDWQTVHAPDESEVTGDWMRNDDATFIAHARSDVPRLVAECRLLQRTISQTDDLYDCADAERQRQFERAESAEARVKALEAALEKYGRHEKPCRRHLAYYRHNEAGELVDVGNPCLCGLDAALHPDRAEDR